MGFLSEKINLQQILHYHQTSNIHVKIPYWEWILRNLHYVLLHLLPTVQSSNILLSEQCFKNPLPPRWIWIVSSIIVESSSSDSLRLRFKQIDDSIHAWILLLMLASAFLSLFSPSSYSSLKAKCELKFFKKCNFWGNWLVWNVPLKHSYFFDWRRYAIKEVNDCLLQNLSKFSAHYGKY